MQDLNTQTVGSVQRNKLVASRPLPFLSGSCIANKPGKTHRAQHWDVSICLVHILVCGDVEPLPGACLGWHGQLRCVFFPQITPLLGR